MSRFESRLAGLGLHLPDAPEPVGAYLGAKVSGDLLFVSGRVSALRGEVDTAVSIAEARLAARDTMLLLLAIAKQEIGNLDRIVSVEFVRGFVRSSPSFAQQPAVIDGASELLISVLGEPGRHARTATGAAQLPYGAAVQLDMILRLSS